MIWGLIHKSVKLTTIDFADKNGMLNGFGRFSHERFAVTAEERNKDESGFYGFCGLLHHIIRH